MRTIEIKTCRECKNTYIYSRGGLVSTYKDMMDVGLCVKCKIKHEIKSIKKIFGDYV